VALPDTRFTADPGDTSPKAPGGWNPTGWMFGIRARSPGQPGTLAAHGLPPLNDAAEVAALVGIDPKELPKLMRPGAESGSPYVEFTVPKASGGTRTISAPRAALKKVQRTILDGILAKLPTHDACHGFVAGRSVVTNAEPHQNAAVVIKMDLVDFFPSVHYRRVAGLFRSYGYNEEVANVLAGLTTHRPKLSDGRVERRPRRPSPTWWPVAWTPG
jgi:hypothetical protein